jgi:putative flavoprotein involved in K+ transport
MKRDDVTRFLGAYARSFHAPVREQTTVTSVSPATGGWQVGTDQGVWRARNVVIATGHTQQTAVPEIAAELPRQIVQIATSDYRRPDQLPEGGVLVVGSSASGVQLADELHRSGRDVTLAVGSHTRVPRRYRGRDIMYWLDRTGALHRPLSDVPNPEEAKREPSLQLCGNELGRNLDLDVLSRSGIRLTGRLLRIEGGKVRFGGDLARNAAAADHQMGRLLARIDRHIETHGLADVESAEPWKLTPHPGYPEELDLRRAGIRSVLWATGYRRSYPWLEADVLDSNGEIRNRRGRTPAPGLFVIGLQFMIRRNSSFIDGVGRDAAEIAGAIAQRADERAREVA